MFIIYHESWTLNHEHLDGRHYSIGIEILEISYYKMYILIRGKFNVGNIFICKVENFTIGNIDITQTLLSSWSCIYGKTLP